MSALARALANYAANPSGVGARVFFSREVNRT